MRKTANTSLKNSITESWLHRIPFRLVAEIALYFWGIFYPNGITAISVLLEHLYLPSSCHSILYISTEDCFYSLCFPNRDKQKKYHLRLYKYAVICIDIYRHIDIYMVKTVGIDLDWSQEPRIPFRSPTLRIEAQVLGLLWCFHTHFTRKLDRKCCGWDSNWYSEIECLHCKQWFNPLHHNPSHGMFVFI